MYVTKQTKNKTKNKKNDREAWLHEAVVSFVEAVRGQSSLSGDDRGLTELPLGDSRLVLQYHRNQHMAKAVLGTVEHCGLLFVILGLTLSEEAAEVRVQG